MKYFVSMIVIIVIKVLLVGCTVDEIVRVGIPFDDDRGEGVEFYLEIESKQKIKQLQSIIEDSEPVERPSDMNESADVFLTLDKPKDSVSKFSRYVWFLEGGSTVLYDGASNYTRISGQQSEELKSIIAKKSASYISRRSF